MNEQQQSVTLKLDINQLNTILTGVAKLPIEMGLETFTEIQKQAHAQLGDPNSNSLPASDLGKMNG